MTRRRQNSIPDEAFKSWVRSQHCIVCELLRLPITFGRTECHHAGHRGLGQSADDKTCIPLCWRHHSRNSSVSVHTLGKLFWARFKLDRFAVIAEVRRRYFMEKGGEWEEAA